MADTESAITYVISIKLDGAEGTAQSSNNGVAPSVNGQSVSGVGGAGKSESAELKGFFKSAPVQMAKGAILAAAHKGISTYINRVSLRTGNEALQERLSFAYSTAQRAFAIGASFVGGLATGNPLAVIGSTAAAMSWAYDIKIQAENIQIQRELEGISIRQANIRAGAGGDRAGRNTY